MLKGLLETQLLERASSLIIYRIKNAQKKFWKDANKSDNDSYPWDAQREP